MTDRFSNQWHPTDPNAPWNQWNPQSLKWREQLRASLVAISLHDWLRHPDKYQWLLGDEAYRQQIVDFLSRAQYEETQAAGIDYSTDNPNLGNFLIGDWQLYVMWSPTRQHLAISWTTDPMASAELWIDGRRILLENNEPPIVEGLGQWLNDEYFTVNAMGPEHHPEQNFMGFNVTSLGEIKSLLIYNAATGHLRIEEPTPHEHWTSPSAQLNAQQIMIFPDISQEQTAQPDRIIDL